tara:strand:+ start:315 stop:986 length:672 start_codon:yes stop_codon:yes gene_type:complete
MATYLLNRDKDQIQRQIRKTKTLNEQKLLSADIDKANKALTEEKSKGSLVGTGVGLLAAIGLTLVTGGAASPLLAAKAVASAPLLAGASAGIGSFLGERAATTGYKGPLAKMLFGDVDEIGELESLVGESKTLTGPGATEFQAEVDTLYGNVDKDSMTEALLRGGTRGLQVGSIAGGVKGIGDIFSKAEPGSYLATLGEKLGYTYTDPMSSGVTFMENFKKGL